MIRVAAVVAVLGGFWLVRARLDRGATPDQAASGAARDEKLAVASRDTAEPAPEPDEPSPWYRAYLGGRRPKGARKLTRAKVGARAGARLDAELALAFEVVPDPGPHALTTVVSLEGSPSAKLLAHVDGEALAPWTLSEGWQVYSTEVPAARLQQGQHELTFRVDGASPSASVILESLALGPVRSEVVLDMGTRAAGALVNGFSKPASTHVWNHGETSTLAVVLAPTGKDYRLTINGSTFGRLSPLTVSAKVNGSSVGAAVFTGKPGNGLWSVPASALGPGLNRIEFSYPKTLSRSDLEPTAKDRRPLALRFLRLELKPVQ